MSNEKLKFLRNIFHGQTRCYFAKPITNHTNLQYFSTHFGQASQICEPIYHGRLGDDADE